MSDVVLYTTAPKSFDKDTTVEVCDKFLYAVSCTATTVNMATTEYTRHDTMRKVSIPSKKALTQERAYNKPGIYFTCNEEKAAELREKGMITMATQVETPEVVAEQVETPEVVETPAPKRKRASRKITTTETREDGTIVHTTAPENESVVAEGPVPEAPVQGCATKLETLVEELAGKPYAEICDKMPEGNWQVVEGSVIKGNAQPTVPAIGPQMQHMLTCKNRIEPEPASAIKPEITPVMQLRGIAQHMLSYEVYENMLEALTAGLETMGMKLAKLGDNAPVRVQARETREPRPRVEKAPRVAGEGVKAKRFDDAWAKTVCDRYATGTIKKGDLATELGIPASTLYHYLRRGNVLHLGKK